MSAEVWEAASFSTATFNLARLSPSLCRERKDVRCNQTDPKSFFPFLDFKFQWEQIALKLDRATYSVPQGEVFCSFLKHGNLVFCDVVMPLVYIIPFEI